MLRIVAALIVFLAGVALRAQEQAAKVVMDDGRVLEGTVVAIELGSMQLRVGNEVLTLSTAQVRSCTMAEKGEEEAPASQEPPKPTETQSNDVPPPAAPAVEPAPAPAVVPERPAEATVAPTAGAPEGAAAAEATPAPPGTKPSRASPRPLPAPIAKDASTPIDERPQSLLKRRLHAVDAVFPWLVPTVPTQWLSVGLLLFALLSLVVHISVRVAGAETATFGRSMAVSLWYLLSGFLQMAMVPSVHVATFSMLIGNTALALFWLRNLFGLSRGGAMVALAVQLGFAVLAYGVLELVTSLLASIGTLPA
jgi:hypothetical protein